MPVRVESRITRLLIVCIACLGLAAAPGGLRRVEAGEPAAPAKVPGPWRSLFDGETLGGWRKTNFGGEGEVYVEDGRIYLDFGNSLTGITYRGEFPASDYEISLEAMRVEGIDFFCGMTFPVADAHCSLIVGGWAGSVVGLSSIDGKDASENETTRYMRFRAGQWRRIRVRVTDDRIQVWIGPDRVVNQSTSGRKISIRPEVELSRPFGICAWETRSALRNIRVRSFQQE